VVYQKPEKTGTAKNENRKPGIFFYTKIFAFFTPIFLKNVIPTQ